jgi:hypothetical protein
MVNRSKHQHLSLSLFSFSLGSVRKLAYLCLALIVGGSASEVFADPVAQSISIRVTQVRNGFEVQASYMAPLNNCQAYALLTDFSSNEPSEGIKSSKITRLSDNTVRVEQVVEDRVLFFPIRFDSVIDYIEHPIHGMDLKQVKGYFKEYQAKWKLIPQDHGTLFSYEAFILPDSIIPRFVVEHFMTSRIHTRFEKMEQRAKARANFIPERCR